MADPRESQTPRPQTPRPNSVRVLAVDPFHGGSHRQFLDGVVKHSRHDWTLVTGKPVHWKWRMRSAPLELAAAAREAIGVGGYPDVVFCSDMLDLPQWRGLLRDERILRTPTAIYFHENQWTYPQSPEARVDFHFGYTNLLAAIAADACWFNSAFHRDDFLKASESFVRKMPDAQQAHAFEQLRQRCEVVPPGFDPPETLPAPSKPQSTAIDSTAIIIGWVSRWEHDKRPDKFVDLVSKLDHYGIDFRLVLLGGRPRNAPQALQELRNRFADRILRDGYAETADQYWSHLASMDVVVSTADHEFFGIAVCEAIWAGAAAVLPNRLSYPELVPPECLYESLDEAVSMIEKMLDPGERKRRSAASRKMLEPLRMEMTAKRLDERLQTLVEEAE